MILFKKSPFITFNILMTFLFIHYVQLNILPGRSVTKPISEIFIFFIFFIALYHIQYKKIRLQYFSSKLILLWLPIFFVTLLYMFYSIIVFGKIEGSIKSLTNIVLIFLFYWFGYNKVGLSNKVFFRNFIIFIYPMFIIGYLEIIGISILPIFLDLVNIIRDTILSYNIDKVRLHLLFSEPSFLPTYLLLILFITNNEKIIKKKKQIFIISILLFILFSKSLNNIALFTIFFISYYVFKKKLSFLTLLKLISITIILVSIIYFIAGDRILNISQDQSSYNRLMHIQMMLNMFYDSYGFGYGFGQYSDYVYTYLNTHDLFIWTAELKAMKSGEMKALSGSMFFQIISEMGVLGTISFLYLFKNLFKRFNPYRHYYLVLLISIFMALPWGLPFVWILLGIMDKKIEEKKNETITHNRR